MNCSLTTALKFFLCLSSSSMNFLISSFRFALQICTGSHSSMSPTLTEISKCVFSYLSAAVTSFCPGKIQFCARWCVGRLLFGFFRMDSSIFCSLHAHFSYDALGSHLEGSCSFLCRKKFLISCFPFVYNFISVIWETFHASMPMAVVVLEYHLCVCLIVVNRSSNKPPRHCAYMKRD